MDKIQYGVLVALIVLVGLLGILMPSHPTISEISKQVAELLRNLGAVSGDTLPDCINQNGSEICRARLAMSSASSTVCSIRAPRHASSTLIGFQANISTATGSAMALVLQTASSSSDGFALEIGAATTSRIIISRDYVASSQNLFSYYATNTPGVFQNNELGSGEYVVFSVKGGQIVDRGSGATLSGACNATFRVNR